MCNSKKQTTSSVHWEDRSELLQRLRVCCLVIPPPTCPQSVADIFFHFFFFVFSVQFNTPFHHSFITCYSNTHTTTAITGALTIPLQRWWAQQVVPKRWRMECHWQQAQWFLSLSPCQCLTVVVCSSVVAVDRRSCLCRGSAGQATRSHDTSCAVLLLHPWNSGNVGLDHVSPPTSCGDDPT